jgi:hypothetical protein
MQAMLDTRALELINAEIDGELAADEHAELQALLASSAEARAMQADLQKLSKLIDSVPEQEPPADLGGRILGQIRQRGRSPSRPTFSLAGVLSSLQPIPIGAAFAAGLLLTVGVYEMSPEQWVDNDVDGMVGTMMLGSQDDLSGQQSRLDIAGPGIFGAVSLSNMGDILVLSFDVAAERETEIVIDMAEAGLGFGGIAHKLVDDAANGGSYEVSGGNLRVVSETSHPFNVYLRRVENGKTHPQGIGIEVIYSGERVFKGLLEFEGERG